MPTLPSKTQIALTFSGNDADVPHAQGKTSIELLEFVNEARTEAGEATIRHNVFLSRCKDELDEGDYKTFVIDPPERGGRPIEAIIMTVDQCKLVAMRESKGVRRRVLARLNALEAQAAQPVQPGVALPDFTNPAAAARAWAEQFEAKAQAQEQLAIAAPKAAFVDQYVECTGLKGFREVAKLLGAKEPEFRAFLQCRGVMYRLGGEWTAYSHHIDAGRFAVKAGASRATGHAYNRSLFTAKGVEWIAGEWAKHQLREVAV